MPNLRIIPSNLADTGAVTASTAALAVANLQDSTRTSVWRASGTAATISVVWPSPVGADSVALMTSNLSSTATWRVSAYDAGGVMVYDSGALLACPPQPLGALDFGFAPLGVNAFAFGLAAQSVLWMSTRVLMSRVEIHIDDTNNPDGYVEAARLVVGARWSPQKNMSYGAQLAFEDRGLCARGEDGSMRCEQGARYRTLKFQMDWLTEIDRARFAEITRQLGVTRDFLISAYPGDTSLDRESHYTMLARFVRVPGITSRTYSINNSLIECEET